jgi:hypothetical protein
LDGSLEEEDSKWQDCDQIFGCIERAVRYFPLLIILALRIIARRFSASTRQAL